MRACMSLLQGPKAFSSLSKTVVAKMPKYPVPQLNATLERYLKSVKPFLSDNDRLCSEAIIKEFGEPGGCGEVLQEKLLERASKRDNWLEEWWINTAYLEYRDPVVIFSSPGLMFPRQKKFESDSEFIECAAKVVAGALDYKSIIDSDKLPQEKFGNSPLDMQQYHKIFGTCRIPKIPRDTLCYNPDSNHIVVTINNSFYKVNVKSNDCWLKYDQLCPLLNNILESAKNTQSCPVGILTSDSRDNWATAYQELSKDEANSKSLAEIEKAIFVLCLDLKEPPLCKNPMTTTSMQLVHGGGPELNSGNRWYDKTIQFVVNKDGGIGLTYEHSPAEGQPIALMMDHIVNYMKNAPKSGENACTGCEDLKFNINDCVKSMIDKSSANLSKLIADVDFNCYSFDSFGKEAIKALKLSPDSFLQMAMQYAFYRLHNTPAAHYESASTRMFIGGRTETIRSCSEESIRFAKAMLNEGLKPQSKAQALRLAIQSHKDYTLAALHAQGCDRHLLGLRLIAKEMGMELPEIFKDKAFQLSTHMRLSTSQVASICDGLMSYGPLVSDGYACCYNPRKENINFGTSKFNSCNETSTEKFKDALCCSLNEMKDVLEKCPPSKL